MSNYKMLAVERRPSTFDEVAGLGAVKDRIRGMLNCNRIPHAILIHGIKGCGKTSLARLIAKYVNCTDRKGEQLCGICFTCETEIMSHPDIQIINCALYGSVADFKTLIRGSRFSPRTHFRVFILDEAHALSQATLASMIMEIEEPAQGAIWILCTTNSEKLPEALVDRCQVFRVEPLSDLDCLKFLRRACEDHNIGAIVDDSLLLRICRTVNGNPRESLQALEALFQGIDGSGKTKPAALKKYVEEKGEEIIGLPSESSISSYLRSVYAGRYIEAISALQQTRDPIKLLPEIATYHREALLARISREKPCGTVHAQFLKRVERVVSCLTPVVMSEMLHQMIDVMESMPSPHVTVDLKLLDLTTRMVTTVKEHLNGKLS